jgi:hypothetical protein
VRQNFIRDERRAFRIIDDEDQFVIREPRVERHNHRADFKTGKDRFEKLRTVELINRHSFAARDAAILQCASQRPRPRSDFAPRLPAPFKDSGGVIGKVSNRASEYLIEQHATASIHKKKKPRMNTNEHESGHLPGETAARLRKAFRFLAAKHS